MAPPPAGTFQPDIAKADTVLWKEALFAADLLLLHSSPVYYGLGVPYGDGSAVVIDVWCRAESRWTTCPVVTRTIARPAVSPRFGGFAAHP